jgi:hypothetical protein
MLNGRQSDEVRDRKYSSSAAATPAELRKPDLITFEGISHISCSSQTIRQSYT